MIFIDYMDSLPDLGGPPPTEEQKAAMRRVFAKCTAWAAAHPDYLPRIPHFEHTCLDRANCQRQHDPYPPIL